MQVARAHGGKTATGSRDTIGDLPESTHLFGKEVRPRLLAAVLRFADELSDGRERASRFFVANNDVPMLSKIHHAYSHALTSSLIKGQELLLNYELTLATIDDDFQITKGGGRRFLLDESSFVPRKCIKRGCIACALGPSERSHCVASL